ncbi:hypothetical protein AAY473_020356 [Plecturocebus cupreus]
MDSYHVAQGGFKLLGSNNPSALASQNAGIIDRHFCKTLERKYYIFSRTGMLPPGHYAQQPSDRLP